jgi:hypothetical protein
VTRKNGPISLYESQTRLSLTVLEPDGILEAAGGEFDNPALSIDAGKLASKRIRILSRKNRPANWESKDQSYFMLKWRKWRPNGRGKI